MSTNQEKVSKAQELLNLYTEQFDPGEAYSRLKNMANEIKGNGKGFGYQLADTVTNHMVRQGLCPDCMGELIQDGSAHHCIGRGETVEDGCQWAGPVYADDYPEVG